MLANAYINSNFYGLMDSIETNNNQNIIDFIWDNLQRGYYCTLSLANYIINKLERLTDNNTSWLLQDRLTWNVLNNLQ